MFLRNIFKRNKKDEKLELPEMIARESKRHLMVNGVRSFIISAAVIASVSYTFLKDAPEKIGEHIAVIAITGPIITGDKETDGWVLSQALKSAMESSNAKAILLDLESPGGSPNDAEHVYRTIMDYRKTSTKPVYASVRGMCASACYYIASAADTIYAHKSSLLGSIGVRVEHWNLAKALSNFDLSKSILTAGEHKALMDPYVEMSNFESEFVQRKILDTLHNQFITAVKEGRGDRLSDDPKIFSGLMWAGEDAKDLGLIDYVKTPTQIMSIFKDTYGVDTLVPYGKQKFKLSSLFSLEAEDVIGAISESVTRVLLEQQSKVIFK